MTSLPKLIKPCSENPATVTASLAITFFVVFAVQTLRTWYRLRHVKGPFWAGFSKVWLIRAVSSGNMHWEFANVNKRYGELFCHL